MRQSLFRFAALLAVAAAACSEPTGVNQSPAPVASLGRVATTGGGQLNIISGNNGLAALNGFPLQDPAVRVLDANGAPVAGASVVFTGAAVAGVANKSKVGFGNDCSAATVGTTQTVATNASGIAIVRWCFTSLGGQSMTATIADGTVVTFSGLATTAGDAPVVTKVWGDVAGTNNSTMGGQIAPANPTVQVTDAAANNLPGVLLSFVPNGDGKVSSSSLRTSAAGLAAVVWTLRTTGTSNTLVVSTGAWVTNVTVAPTVATFSVTGLPVGTTMTVLAGAAQTDTVQDDSQIGPKNPAIQITKSTGNVGAGVAVAVTFGAGTYNCYPQAYPILFTDANGSVATRWCLTAPLTAGSKTITFTAGNLTQTITATAVAHGAGAVLTRVWGVAAQTAAVGTIVAQDPTVTVADDNGIVLVNAPVTFTAVNSGTVANGGTSGAAITVNTDATGQAAVRWTLGTVVGSQTLNVTTSLNPAATVSFTATATVGAAARIFIVQGDGLTGTANANLPKDPTVRVTDQYFNTILGTSTYTVDGWSDPPTNTVPSHASYVCSGGECVNVTFTVTAGGGSVVSGVVKTGLYTAGYSATSWKLGAAAGTNTLTASIPNGQSVTFTAVGQ